MNTLLRTTPKMTEISLSRQDRAISGESEDDLDRDPFIDNLIKALVEDIDMTAGNPKRRSTGLVVGLTGEWGLGKSSVLNLLAERLGSMEQTVVASFNPWLFKGRDELVDAFFNALRRAIGKNAGEKYQDALKALDTYRSSIEKAGDKGALVADAHGGGGWASVGWKIVKFLLAVLKPRPARTPDEERRSLEEKIAATSSAIVVLIDELDRVEDEEVRAVAQLIKALGDIKGISYLVAYDPKRVADALGRGAGPERQASGEAYLEKIIQMPIPLRPLFQGDVDALLPAILRRFGLQLLGPREGAEFQHQSDIIKLLSDAIRTPREVKRLVASYQFYERIVRGEICEWDLLAYSWLASKSPSLRDRIAEKMEAVVSDPGEAEMLRQVSLRFDDKRKSETVVDVLGGSAEPHEKLLQVIFPRFDDSRRNPEGTRLARRRNLTRLLYLGNPPGMIARSEIEELWELPIDQIRGKLEIYRSNDKLGPLLDRLLDLLSVLPSHGDGKFWLAFSLVLMRKSDWAESRTNAGSLIEDAGKAIWNLGQMDPSGAERVKLLFNHLRRCGDLLLSPWLLRKHLFAYRLTIHSKKDLHDREAVFDMADTKIILAQEAQRYRKAIINGYALRRLPDNEAMYVLGNADLFDDELRESLTKQIDSMAALASFAAITVPPGYVSDKQSLNQFVDADAIARRIPELTKSDGLPADDWLRMSVRRLEATLKGLDPDFPNPGSNE